MIQQQYLYEVTTDNFVDSGENENLYNPAPKLVPKGTIIEIRYPYEWHFRANKKYKAETNFSYGHAKPEVIEQNAELIGRVNRLAGTGEDLPIILLNELFDKFVNKEFVNMPESAYLFLIEGKIKYLEEKADKNSLLSIAFSTFSDIEKDAKSRNLVSVITKIQEAKQRFGISE